MSDRPLLTMLPLFCSERQTHFQSCCCGATMKAGGTRTSLVMCRTVPAVSMPDDENTRVPSSPSFWYTPAYAP